jgi:hypothetical protein
MRSRERVRIDREAMRRNRGPGYHISLSFSE